MKLFPIISHENFLKNDLVLISFWAKLDFSSIRNICDDAVNRIEYNWKLMGHSFFPFSSDIFSHEIKYIRIAVSDEHRPLAVGLRTHVASAGQHAPSVF